MKILILGVTCMVGNTKFRYFSSKKEFQVVGTLRNTDKLCYFPEEYHSNLLTNFDILDQDVLISSFKQVCPEVIINCSGLVKQREEANDPLLILPVNAMLPHRLDKLCSLTGSRLIQFSTDCVFSGKKGMYRETDKSDADDLYGKSKYIGEVQGSPSTIILRKSIKSPLTVKYFFCFDF